MKKYQWIVGAMLALSLSSPTQSFAQTKTQYQSNRPAVDDRHFTSEAIEKIIAEVKEAIKDPKLRWMFENCYPNTLDTTVKFQMKGKKPDTFVLTGDIHAMWLRDSSAQLWPYLQLMQHDKKTATAHRRPHQQTGRMYSARPLCQCVQRWSYRKFLGIGQYSEYA